MNLSIRGLGGLIALLSLPSVSSASRPNLASVDENSGIKVVFEYVTATDCSNVCGASPAAATTFVTTIPQLCPTGWTDVAFTVTAPLSGHHPMPTGGKDVGPPPGFTTMITECTVCGPQETLVTVTVPVRTVEKQLPPSVIFCPGGGHDVPYVPSAGPIHSHSRWSSSKTHSSSTVSKPPAAPSSISPSQTGTWAPSSRSSVSSSSPSASWGASVSSSTVSSADTQPSASSESSILSVSSSASSSTVSESEYCYDPSTLLVSASTGSESSVYPSTSSESSISSSTSTTGSSSIPVQSSSSTLSQSSSSIPSHSSSSAPLSSSSAPLSSSSSTPSSSSTSPSSPSSSPTKLSSCEPKFTLSGVSPSSFNSAPAGFKLVLECGELDTGNYSVFVNSGPVVGTANTATSIDLPRMSGGYFMVTVMAFDTTGWPIFQSFQLVFGSHTLQVAVRDAEGSPVAGVDVEASATTYVDVGQTATTDSSGIATFQNVPSTTISLKVATADGQFAVGSVAGGHQFSASLTLIPFHPAAAGSDGFDVENGTTGWTGGSTTTTITKRDDRLARRDAAALEVGTNSSPSLQTASKSFSLPPDASMAFIEYLFQTDEVPGGYFGTQFNDYFSVTIRTEEGALTSVVRSMNELGLGAFDAAGSTTWLTTQVGLPGNADSVGFLVAVSNVVDALFQSKVVVRKVGICDKCATCEQCPSLAKCQDVCLHPPLDSCAFYQSCVEETVRCGAAGYALASAQQTCNKFQNAAYQFSEAGKKWFLNAEQCAQLSLLPLLSCDATCDGLAFAGWGSLPNCYTKGGDLCDLEGPDYVHIMEILGGDLSYKGAVAAAVSSVDGCSRKIVDTIDAAIQVRIAAAADGHDYYVNLFDAHALSVARRWYHLLAPFDEASWLPVDDAVAYIQQVYDTAKAFAAPQADILGMGFLRYDAYNTYEWITLVGTIPPEWMLFASAEGLAADDGLPRYNGFVDPALPPLNIRFNHLFATMAGVFVDGDGPSGDITGWLGDLYAFFGDWQRTSPSSSAAEFVQANLGQNTDTSFSAEQLRQDADAYNIAKGLLSGAYGSMAEGFKSVVQGGGYATRIATFFNARFGGSQAVASQLCMGYMTAELADNPLAWTARNALVVRGGACSLPTEIAAADLQAFCDAFAAALASMAASG